MSFIKRSGLCLVASLMLGACASVSSISLTPIPEKRSQVVEAQVSKFIFLAFNFNNDYVDELTTQLKDRCPKGRVEGVMTKHEIRSYFIAHTVMVTARGFCNVDKRA